MLITTSLIAIFFGGVYEAVFTGLRATHAADERDEIRLQLANTLERLTRELSLANGVDNAEDQRCQFDTAAENNINYRVQSGDLERVQGGTTVVLVRDLASADFDYVEEGATSAADCDNTSSCDSVCCHSEIGTVHVTLTATKNGETITVSTAAYLRNNS